MQCHWNAVHVLYTGDLLPFFLLFQCGSPTQVVTRKHTKHKVEFKLVQKHYYTLDFCLVPMLFLSAIDFSSGSDIHTNVIRDPFTAITSSHYAFPEITLMRLIR